MLTSYYMSNILSHLLFLNYIALRFKSLKNSISYESHEVALPFCIMLVVMFVIFCLSKMPYLLHGFIFAYFTQI